MWPFDPFVARVSHCTSNIHPRWQELHQREVYRNNLGKDMDLPSDFYGPTLRQTNAH